MTTPTTVQVGDRTVRLVAPGDPAAVADIYIAEASSPLRACMAALGACWTAGGSPGRPAVQYRACKYNALVYGGRVYAELLDRGLKLEDFADAAKAAYRIIGDAFIGEEDVQGVEDFGGAPAGSSDG